MMMKNTITHLTLITILCYIIILSIFLYFGRSSFSRDIDSIQSDILIHLQSKGEKFSSLNKEDILSTEDYQKYVSRELESMIGYITVSFIGFYLFLITGYYLLVYRHISSLIHLNKNNYKSFSGKIPNNELGLLIKLREEGIKNGIKKEKESSEQIKEIENKLRQSAKLSAIGELSSSIMHDINNPLTAISGSIEFINIINESEIQNPQIEKAVEESKLAMNSIKSTKDRMMNFVRKSSDYGYNDLSEL
tara:strand:- start:7406 stop:8152 length:747 start_codon:yes stop_codon:yes gene_type:complete